MRRMIAMGVLVLSIGIGGSAAADDVEVVFATPDLADGNLATKARDAIKGLSGVASVDVDTFKKSIRVRFDDDRLMVSEIVSALTSVDCSVSGYEKQ